jgi:hypothetical protein
MGGPVYIEPADFLPMVRGLRLVADHSNRTREDHMPKLPEPDQFTITLKEGDMAQLRNLCQLEAIRMMALKTYGVLNRKGAARCDAVCELTTMLRETMPISSGVGK